ncbi:hypothetical protein EZJ19_11810 [Parasulfuritortus cantonensis]|uniref:Lipoprotein n=1 Tax=Parasulfuritortus cantonensis TaxID=2528202 RepID=A0A4R1B822_9PROT|nr:hypothetical protein [Parasulfuritortus cantonensis]TCJ12908.1 hypothetical protein EZJ19_11810 [Parasulfuritortus cantonensis]
MKPSASVLLLAGAPVLLAGCVQDTASYMIDGDRNHSIMVMRSQDLPWGDVSLAVTAARQPDCLGGLDIKGVPRNAELVLHQAPPDYAEPIYILTVGKDDYAVSTQSCRVQKFAQAPADAGPEIGRFKEVDGTLEYVAAAK